MQQTPVRRPLRGPADQSKVTLLAHLVGVSERVAATPARLSKVRALADFLRSLPPEDIETAVLYLSGETRQGASASVSPL